MPGQQPGLWQQRFRPWLYPQPSALPSDTGPQVVNQWAVTFAQPAAFQTTPPALQSSVVALTPGNSVMTGGTGTPSSGNWLFAICGWNQSGLAAATVGDADDIHSFWRPGDVTTSTWAVSTSAGATRTSIWYTANLCRQPGDVYCAPNGAQAGRSLLVVEVAGLGPWDVVTGVNTNYAAAATSLGLALGAPSSQAFILAAVTGDSSAAGQAFAPAGWSVLHATTASNGSDHTCDAVLTPACTVTSGSVSVTATTGSASDLSGVAIGVLTAAPSPVPSGANPAWPGRMILEAAFGAGMETPPDQMTWTALSDSAWTSTAQGWKRFWGWADNSGVPYALGQLQSGTGAVQLDNWDGAVSPIGSASPWQFTVSGTPAAATYFIVTAGQALSVSAGQAFTDTSNPGTLFQVTGVSPPSAGFVNISFTPPAGVLMANPDVVTQAAPTTGTPVRLRMALGTLKDGTVVNRWYTWARDALAWPEKRNKALRGYVPAALTDVWSGVAGSCPSPYRAEIRQDAPYAWWACDDQPLAGGVFPVSLRNSALGNTNVLNVVLSPNGATAQAPYGIDGNLVNNPPYALAGEAFAQNAGWMYGDPQSSPASYQTSNPVTSNPGSASWQATGQQGNTGSYGFFLSCNDNGFPPLANGVTVEGWFNYAYLGSTTFTSVTLGHSPIVAQQPTCPLTLWEIATGSNPVAILQLDTSGHLNFITYSGATPTSHSVYTSSDLRSNSWWHVAVSFNQTAWTVYLDGGVTATVSGSSAAMTSAWTWIAFNGDFGANGGSAPGTGLVHGGNASFSHLAVYPSQLPAWRVLAHYCAAVTGFGVIPAPQQVTVQITNGNNNTVAPDGSVFSGSYGSGPVSYSAKVAAIVGSYNSGPSAWATGYLNAGGGVANIYTWVGWTGLAAKFAVYNATALGSELQGDYAAGAGDVLTSGYGATTTGAGVAHLSGGNTGASPPAAASSLGDTVAQRLERILGAGMVTRPNRAIDATASLLVQAATDTGGQQTGASIQNIADSDNGLLYVDNNGTLCYRSRPHLAADTVTWYIGMDVIAGMVPFDDTIEWSSDPQRIWDAITITPYSPDGASLASLTPSDAATADAAQAQFGVRPKQVTSYLQDAAKQQAQADWYLVQFGGLRRRASAVAIDAASHPAAWLMVAGMNPGDIAQVYDAPFGQPATTGTYRVSRIARSLSYGANGSRVEAKLVLALDPIPTSYWS